MDATFFTLIFFSMICYDNIKLSLSADGKGKAMINEDDTDDDILRFWHTPSNPDYSAEAGSSLTHLPDHQNYFHPSPYNHHYSSLTPESHLSLRPRIQPNIQYERQVLNKNAEILNRAIEKHALGRSQMKLRYNDPILSPRVQSYYLFEPRTQQQIQHERRVLDENAVILERAMMKHRFDTQKMMMEYKDKKEARYSSDLRRQKKSKSKLNSDGN